MIDTIVCRQPTDQIFCCQTMIRSNMIFHERVRSYFLANILICPVNIFRGMIFVVGALKVILTQCYVYNYAFVIFFNDIMCTISFPNLSSSPACTISQSLDIYTPARVGWGILVSSYPSVRPFVRLSVCG